MLRIFAFVRILRLTSRLGLACARLPERLVWTALIGRCQNSISSKKTNLCPFNFSKVIRPGKGDFISTATFTLHVNYRWLTKWRSDFDRPNQLSVSF